VLPALWTSADYAPSVQLKDQSIARLTKLFLCLHSVPALLCPPAAPAGLPGHCSRLGARSRGSGCSEAAAATVPTWAIGGGKGPAATAGGRLELKLELHNS